MANQTEIRQQITDQIIESLADGNLPPWRKPWSNDPNAGLNTSLSTGESYRGINQLILQLSAARQEFQIQMVGDVQPDQQLWCQCSPGTKGDEDHPLEALKRKRHNEQGKEVDDSFLVMREFCVFNAEQTTGTRSIPSWLCSTRQRTPVNAMNTPMP